MLLFSLTLRKINRMGSFSSKKRNQLIVAATQTNYDVLVIGGGITGCGIALDAASRGLKVLVLEMQDFASGTSGRSTKLIHGGLRYLKQLEFGLVAEVGKERKIVHQNAPHLTKPEPMLLPIVKGGSLGKFTGKLGMLVYEWLAGVKREEKHLILNKKRALEKEPLLQENNLLGGILFYEYRTDDSRLTMDVIKEAVEIGANAINYIKVKSFLYKDEKIIGVVAIDLLTNAEHTFFSKHVVNASGPWVDEVDNFDRKQPKELLNITKGVHIVVDWKKLPVKQSLYIDTADKRMIFIIPRENKTYIGTTDTFYKGNIENPLITIEDRKYLLDCVNAFFPKVKLTSLDIESSWTGLRPLISKPGKGPSEISRKDELFEYPSGLITIAGGKLTGYRKMAQRVVDTIRKRMETNSFTIIPNCKTDKIKLAGGKLENASLFDGFLKVKMQELSLFGLTSNKAETLVRRYGTCIDKIIDAAKTLKNKTSLPALLEAELNYCIEEEMCVTPLDFFIRRTSTIYFDIDSVLLYKVPVTEYMQVVFNWSNEKKELLLREVDIAIQQLR